MLIKHIFNVRKVKPILAGISSSRKFFDSSVTFSNHHLNFIKNHSKKLRFDNGQRMHTTNATQLSTFKRKDHHYTWIWERATAIALIGVLPATFLSPSLVTESLACVIIGSHLHWGLEAIGTDYLRPAVVGKFIPKYISFIVLIPTAVILYGYAKTIAYSKGMSHLLRQLWSLKTTEEMDLMDNINK